MSFTQAEMRLIWIVLSYQATHGPNTSIDFGFVAAALGLDGVDPVEAARTRWSRLRRKLEKEFGKVDMNLTPKPKKGEGKDDEDEGGAGAVTGAGAAAVGA